MNRIELYHRPSNDQRYHRCGLIALNEEGETVLVKEE